MFNTALVYMHAGEQRPHREILLLLIQTLKHDRGVTRPALTPPTGEMMRIRYTVPH
jgi:hypothetical protein